MTFAVWLWGADVCKWIEIRFSYTKHHAIMLYVGLRVFLCCERVSY